MENLLLPSGEDVPRMTNNQSAITLVSDEGEGSDEEVAQREDRPAWDSKLQYVLAQVGFSVGLGNVWRFPYLCHQNGGGSFLLLYVMLLLLIGVPLFFMELAAGQNIRQGSIGVWKHISPRLSGIGYSSCLVCFFMALYYNVIVAWALFYLGSSFQYPLPWQQCPTEHGLNQTVKECALSSPTSYFWFRKALDISDSIDQSGDFNPVMTGCLLAAWVIVCLAMIKGIKSSAKVMYFSSIFPYAVLFCFLIRGLMLDGAIDGLTYMFFPKLEIWGEVQVWRQAATQVFFSLGLGYGSVIAYSSYNPINNNCHRDAFMVSGINFMTSVLASLVVFAVLGFRAKNIALGCVVDNMSKISAMASPDAAQDWKSWFNISDPRSVELKDYQEWYKVYGTLAPNITDCNLEREMSRGVEGTGLAFIAFTEAMALFPGSPFWSALFFLMLLNLGMTTMFGTMQGILTPLMDNFKLLGRHKTLLTMFSCILGFLIGLLFTQRSGNYFVTMFDDYSATLPLIIVVIFETISVAWVYGADRFLDDMEVMLKWRPPAIYKYLWKYVCLLAMVGLLTASLLRMFFKWPTYTAWNHTTASESSLGYPGWALVMLALLITVASIPVPAVYIHSFFSHKQGQSQAEGGAEHHRDQYTKCSTNEPELNNHHAAPDDDSAFLPGALEQYKLVSLQEDGEEVGDDTEL
ncbi:sodium-dependent neutral amino acid transporter B(0)AT2 [Tachysurus vachellii]|uniref:sodium-dependent neutral amino acid transporter B(0)AT2 n=1 Tax=Tachysurus vachellii TaxID=175792 RepID=UPI00296B0428|nr:sodium-dependent neutral amino acid transporter B(0)AT2 [Tachysurus vachellii]